MIDLHPIKCNICGGRVIYTSNSAIYGHPYGSGKCYLCTNCGAYVGTHRPRPTEALGILADKQMRDGKIICHTLFDKLWKGKRHAVRLRRYYYDRLAAELNIPVSECHFGYFDLPMLRKAYMAVCKIKEES